MRCSRAASSVARIRAACSGGGSGPRAVSTFSPGSGWWGSSKLPAAVTPSQAIAGAASGPSSSTQFLLAPHVVAALDALRVGVERRVEAALGSAHLAQRPAQRVERDVEEVPARRSPARRAGRRVRAARCRRASSRSAAPSTRRRRCSGRSRRRAGRGCLRLPSLAASTRPSRALPPRPPAAAGTRAPKPAGTSGRPRSRRCSASIGRAAGSRTACAQRRLGDRRRRSGASRAAPESCSRSCSPPERICSPFSRHDSAIACSTWRPRGHAVARLGREVGAAVEGDLLRRQEHVQRPAAASGHALHRLHVERVDVGALLAVDLHAHELLVHHGGGGGVLEGLALHHVAPVAGRVADRDEHRHVALARPARTPPRPRGASRRGSPRAGAGTARSPARARWPRAQGSRASAAGRPRGPPARSSRASSAGAAGHSPAATALDSRARALAEADVEAPAAERPGHALGGGAEADRHPAAAREPPTRSALVQQLAVDDRECCRSASRPARATGGAARARDDRAGRSRRAARRSAAPLGSVASACSVAAIDLAVRGRRACRARPRACGRAARRGRAADRCATRLLGVKGVGASTSCAAVHGATARAGEERRERLRGAARSGRCRSPSVP